MRKARRSLRNNRGSEILQVVLGGIVLVPLALFFLDVIYMVLCATVNADAAKLAARAAANQQNEKLAREAADATLKTQGNGLGRPTIKQFSRTSEKVKVFTEMEVRMPAPFPFFEKVTLSSGEVVEPVVALAKRKR